MKTLKILLILACLFTLPSVNAVFAQEDEAEESTHSEILMPEVAHEVQEEQDSLSPVEKKIRETLDASTALDYEQVPLDQIAEDLSKKLGFPVRLDAEALKEARVEPDMPITFQVRGILLGSALRLMLGGVDLDFAITADALLFTSRQWEPPIPENLTPEFAQEVFENQNALSPEEKKVLAAMDAPTALDYEKVPLDQVTKDLSEKLGFSVRLDTAALEEMGLEPDMPISLRVRDISLRNALRCMFHGTGLDFVITSEVLLITSEVRADDRLETRAYPWRFYVYEGSANEMGFFMEGDEKRPSEDEAAAKEEFTLRIESDTVIDYLVNAVHRDTWEENGGQGRVIAAVAAPGEKLEDGKMVNGFIVLAACQRVHEQIPEALQRYYDLMPDELTDKLIGLPMPTDEAKVVELLAPRRLFKPPGEVRLERALDTMVSLHIPPEGFTLRQLAEQLEKSIREKGVPVNVLVDWHAMENRGYERDENEPICRDQNFYNVSLRVLIRELVIFDTDEKLDFLLLHDSLWLTTHDKAFEHMYTRLYPVNFHLTDFVEEVEWLTELGYPGTTINYALILENIIIMCPMDFWRECGGPGPVGTFPSEFGISVWEWYGYHRWVEEFLSLYNGWEIPMPEADKRLAGVLAANVALEYKGKPLAEVLRDLSEKFRITLRSDSWYLRDNDMDVETLHVTLSAKDIPLQEALRQILAPHGLEAAVYPGGLLKIQSKIEDWHPKVLRFYPWDFSVHNPDAVAAALDKIDPRPEDEASDVLSVGFLSDNIVALAKENIQQRVREILDTIVKESQ